ncbi:DUF3107 domain-containing protein [Actinoallomurus bryophytorum]|uniref:Uncharacterized protein DUF3107 n=1 Tax=Actinoallomurus bryophytorum TaxID=1490222 RepID=A0A543CEX0_9ACTN|nr:DUF3107 domain-containing protein [Actinoallomurus bryophytorum]TQL95644.1 uncharacterized protein DUF3107 [Actinoallomurus bryophytorum]
MQVRIGVQSVPKELVVETSLSADEVERAVSEALSDADGVFTINSKSGRIVVPAAKLAYVEIGVDEAPSVGFGTF